MKLYGKDLQLGQIYRQILSIYHNHLFFVFTTKITLFMSDQNPGQPTDQNFQLLVQDGGSSNRDVFLWLIEYDAQGYTETQLDWNQG